MTTLHDVHSWLDKPASQDLPVALTIVEEAPAAETVAETVLAPVPEPVTQPTVEAPSAAMARLLEIAVRNAEELVAEATTEAEELTAAARAEADEMLAEARRECEQVRTATDELRQSEQEHQEGMRAHLTALLEKLEAAPSSD